MGNIRQATEPGAGCRHEGLVAHSRSVGCPSAILLGMHSREYPVGGAVAHTAKEYTSNGE